ncbi:efflux RND transporter periplasmic adaptor subunit [Cytophagaceae bacterium 50C-KIRBA]|uniref:Efflux RND transporter periplasmic adaptor subunit n=1 Tax=Aquirufa beregesia TaxID=2516556 RepID=A0ABX0EZG0_9BACT|nr:MULTISPECIES: efflux RND transporter periplasmic adaptor subunit [Aquirufa]MDF0692678.1 efflux RND transporter periplasmic adaptor subunit [Aquirufa ecclesiirivi]NGZ45503.1 efflux RND transporter periplasmic adaptor subunit [Aquirufa beregesia]NHC47955.1 efflux RND transporter periplasmic adaptor subunit [Aquirufa ecclesiirivi]
MNTKTSILKKALYIIIPLVLIAIVVIKLKNNKEITQSKVYQYDKEQAISIQADTLQIENVNAEISYSGTFEPNKETKISAEIQGKINDVLVEVGSNVNKGHSLIQLDNSLLKLQLQTIEVQIEGLEADVNRHTILAKADAIQGVLLEKSILGLKSAKVQKATLVEQIHKTTIKAPFNGVVTAKLSEEGAFAAPGVPLLQITDITNLKFTVNVPENELSQFKLNQKYSVSVDAYSEISLAGKATMIGSKANMGSSFPIQFTVNNTSDVKIKSGMFGKVNLKNDIQEKGIIISSSVIVGSENQPQVYLIKNGKAVLQNITISKKIQNKSIVSSGLKPGDAMVTSGFINLFDGAKVTVK